MVKSPALRDPPIEALVPGFIAPVPEVSVREPPGLIMSYLETTDEVGDLSNIARRPRS